MTHLGVVRHDRQQHRKLVTTEAGRSAELADAAGNASGHLFEQRIAGGVTHGVVHGLEVVEVDEEHGQVGTGLQAVAQGALQSVLEERLVGEPGQGVVEGPVRELVLQELAVGDIPEAVDPSDQLPRDQLGPATARRPGRP